VYMIRHHHITKQLNVEVGPKVVEMVEKKPKDVIVAKKTVSMVTRKSNESCSIQVIEMTEFCHSIG
jgi:hypothetical protein